MADVNFDLEVAQRQITKDLLQDLGIVDALKRVAAKPNELIDEYGKYYKQLYKYIYAPLK